MNYPLVTFAAMKPHEIRRTNLQKLIEKNFDGKAGRLADALGKKRPLIYRLFSQSEDSRREIGEALAREIEQKLGLPVGWLDLPDADASQAAIQPAQPKKNFLARLAELQREYEDSPPAEKELIDEAIEQNKLLKRLMQKDNKKE